MSKETKKLVADHAPILRDLALKGSKHALDTLEALLRSDATAIAVETIIAHYEQQRVTR